MSGKNIANKSDTGTKNFSTTSGLLERLNSFERTAMKALKEQGPVTYTKTEWANLPSGTIMATLGKDAVFFGNGCHLVFYNAVTHQSQVHRVNGYETGDGVQCIAGHGIHPIFAFAEIALNARIFVMKYPEMKIICKLEDGAPEGYLSLSFTYSDYLLSLSRQPYYTMTLWNWRTHNKILETETFINDPKQFISCNLSYPVHLVQLGLTTSELYFWEIHTYFRKCFTVYRKIRTPNVKNRFVNVCWSTDGTLFILDERSTVYMVTGIPITYDLVQIINAKEVLHTFDDAPPALIWHKQGILVSISKWTVVHFSRVGDEWVGDYEVAKSSYKSYINQFGYLQHRDILLAWCDGGFLLELDHENQRFNFLQNFTSDFMDFELIYPLGTVYVTYSKNNALESWCVKTGENYSILEYEADITSIRANPRFPYVVVGFRHGDIQMVSIVQPEAMKVMAEFHLDSRPINKVKFNSVGNILVAANIDFGQFFILKGLPGEKIEIVSHIDYRRAIVDFAVQETKFNYQIYKLIMKEGVQDASNKIVVKFVSKLDGKVKKKKFKSPVHSVNVLPNIPTRSILTTMNSENVALSEEEVGYIMGITSMTFLAKKQEYYSKISIVDDRIFVKPYGTKTVRLVELENKKIKVKAEYPTGHLLRHMGMYASENHCATYGYDGIITIHTRDMKELLAAFRVHHRSDKGVKKTITCPTLKYTISLGYKGCLVCTNLINLEEDPELISYMEQDYEDQCRYFEQRTIGYVPEGKYEGKNYVEVHRLKEIAEEEKHSKVVQKSLRQLFAKIKKEVIELLEGNISGPELEKINVLEFYLHKKMKDHKEALANFECEWTRKWCKQMIEAQDKVAEWIKNHCWHTMEIKRVSIHGICANFSVENYAYFPADPKSKAFTINVNLQRTIEELLRADDTLLPWLPASDHALRSHLDKAPKIKRVDERMRIEDVILVGEGEGEDDEFNLRSSTNFIGYSTWLFLKPNDLIFSQFETHTFGQMRKQIQLLFEEDRLLSEFYNVKFNELMSIKQREMAVIKEKNDRLRYILSELKNTVTYIQDPQWHPHEKPESIITVEPHEIPITPYISPSEQLILDAAAAEAERIRLLLLADDFRERALMAMMHGVLEIRWEDTIKRDIPKPKCMLEKPPEEWNEEDLITVKDYEEKVAFLMSERQRYKNMLEAEYAKISDVVKESVKKFNTRLRDLLSLKLKMESARRQQVLRAQLMQVYSLKRIKLKEKEGTIIANMRANDDKIAFITEQLQILSDTVIECKAASEIILAKEKQLEKHFKKDFAEFSNLTQSHAMKLYKKHPRANVKGLTSASLLHELGRCVVNYERTITLTPECTDYLRSVDALDQYIGVPNTIDESMYKVLCRHRRYKLENDLKMKANGVDQQDIELTTVYFQRRLNLKKDYAAVLIERLNQARNEMLEYKHNKPTLIVIKQGYVEIPLTGKFSDFDKVLVVRRKDVEAINTVIQHAGMRKLKVMNDKMLHRRNILLKEWQHRHMTMEIEDLESRLHVVGSIKVTKEIQAYLKNRAKGYPPDKGMLTLDQEIEMIRNSYERVIMERKVKVDELEAQIKDYKKKNKLLDKKIAEINIDVCEQQLNRNLEFEEHTKKSTKNKMAAIVKRSKLVKTIQDQHNEILVLQTELELLRLKTYPTLKFKTLD